MNYYCIKYSIVEQEVGLTYPQSQTARDIANANDPRHLARQEIGTFPSDVILPQPVLHPDAKITDLISSVTTSLRLVVSTRLKLLLEKHMQWSSGEFLPITVHHTDTQFSYWLYNPVMFRLDVIDYQASEIWLANFGFSKLEKVVITSVEDFMAKVNSLSRPQGLLIEKVVLRDDISLGLFHLKYVSGGIGFYVSEKLKMEIENEGCSGIAFEELSNG